MTRVGATILAVFLSAVAMARAGEAPIVLPAPLSLVDGDGRTVTTGDFAGKFILVYFGYTHCADLCPTGMSVLAAALEQLGPAASHVQPIFITVDPEHDTGAVLNTYPAAFDPRIKGLGGSAAQVSAATKALNVPFEQVRRQNGDYYIDHSTNLTLIAPGGRTAYTISAGTPYQIAGAVFDRLAQAGIDLSDVPNIGAYR